MQTNYPAENWGQYLINDTTVNWQAVVIAGHSQGAGHATFGSKFFQMNRVIMLSWVDWMWPGTNPLWITQTGQTPDSAYFGFIHTGDASIFSGIPTTWTNLGMNPFGAIENIDSILPPYNHSHSLITSAPINQAPTQTNYHNATCVDWVTTITQFGDTLYKPVWEYLLGKDFSVDPNPNAIKISPTGVSWIDPEILQSHNKMGFQVGGSGIIWIGDLDPLTGLFVNNGTDLFIDNGATPLTTSKNGPEFGISSNGWSVFYTKATAGISQPWRAVISGTTVNTAPLTSGTVPRLSTVATKDTSATSIKILYGKGAALNNSEISWMDENNPAVEVVVDSLDEGVRWIDGTHSFVYTKQTGINAGQLALYNTNTSSETIITNDTDKKTYSYGWHAPEQNELLVMCIVNDSTLGIYKNNGNTYWDRIATIEAPPTAYPFRFFGSPEPFVTNDKSYVSFVLKTVSTTSGYVDAEVWVMDLEPSMNDRFMLRCDDGLPNTKRTDPESFMGTNEVFIYYNQINSTGEFEIWRYATGIPTSTLTAIESENSVENQVRVYPNPAVDRLYVKGADSSGRFEIRDITGRMVARGSWSEEGIPVAVLAPGMYFIRIGWNGGRESNLKFIKH